MKPFARLFRRAPPPTGQPSAQGAPADYWSLPPQQLLSALHATAGGLSPADVELRLKQYGLNVLEAQRKATALGLFLSQFKSPLVLILIGAAIVSGALGEWTDAIIVLAVVLGSTVLGFVQEYRAGNAVEKLRSQVTIRSSVLRGGRPQMLPSEQVVPGDVVLLSAGSLIPADGVVLVANDLFVNQAVLTGEAFPVEKQPGTVAAKASLAERTNCVFMGTSAGSGTGQIWLCRPARPRCSARLRSGCACGRRRPSSSAASIASGTCSRRSCGQ